MKEKFNNMLESIKTDLIFLANEVENAIYKSIKSLEMQDKEMAKDVRKADREINYREIDIEKYILSLMALQQPVAMDLRFVIVALKMNNDLERMGDHAKSIAKSVKRLAQEPYIKPIEDILQLGKLTRNMMHDSVQSFIYLNTELAEEVRQRDKDCDELYKKIYNDVIKVLETEKKYIQQGVEIISVAKQLERISDLSKNICEDVIFMKDARIIRYGFDKPGVAESES